MGQTVVSLTVHGPRGSEALEALVDTGATFTKVPQAMAMRLGLEASYETPVELADGRTVIRRLALAEVEVEGVRRPVLVAVGTDGERPLVGYTTLEILGFKVNPITHRLEKTPAIEYRAMAQGRVPIAELAARSWTSRVSDGGSRMREGERHAPQ